MKSIKDAKIYKEIKTNIKEIWFLIRSNIKLVLPFLLVFSIVNLVFTDVVFNYGAKLAMYLHNITYISPDNLLGFYASYKTIILILILYRIFFYFASHIFTVNVGIVPFLRFNPEINITCTIFI